MAPFAGTGLRQHVVDAELVQPPSELACVVDRVAAARIEVEAEEPIATGIGREVHRPGAPRLLREHGNVAAVRVQHLAVSEAIRDADAGPWAQRAGQFPSARGGRNALVGTTQCQHRDKRDRFRYYEGTSSSEWVLQSPRLVAGTE
ncbi:hypothetical protein ACFPRL_34085 [Pseudoclavibacter helvolus]